jgi:hypothetical protein
MNQRKKVKLPGKRFGPPPLKGPSSQGLKLNKITYRQSKKK